MDRLLIATLYQLFYLLVGHAIADFALQTDFIVRNKNRHTPITYVPPGQIPQIFWPYVLTAHALIHGGFVALATGSPILGVAETICHWVIDFGKCENKYGIHTDQLLHFLCKLLWLTIIFVNNLRRFSY